MKKSFLATLGVVGLLTGCHWSVGTNNKPIFELHIIRNFENKKGSTDYATVRIPTYQMLQINTSKTDFTDTKGMVYLTSGSYFTIKNPTNQLALEYTIINMPDKPNGIWRSFDEAIIKAQSLPPSAWRTHTIYPKQLLEQGRAMPANGEPAKNWAHGTKVTVTLYIDGHGNISQEIKHEPIRKDKWTT